MKKVAKAKKIPVPLCQWFLKCFEPAVEMVPHPVLGQVPCCARCAAFVAFCEQNAKGKRK